MSPTRNNDETQTATGAMGALIEGGRNTADTVAAADGRNADAL